MDIRSSFGKRKAATQDHAVPGKLRDTVHHVTIAHKNYLASLSVPMKDSTSSDEENEDQPLAELSTPKESTQQSTQVTCRDADIGKFLSVLQQGRSHRQ